MDLKGSQSGPDAVPESGAGIGNDVDSSGSCVNERAEDQVVSTNINVQVNETARTSCSPGMNSASPGVSGGSAPRKGYGLKKWKRIRRVDLITNLSHGSDSGKVLKQDLFASSNPLPQLAKETQGTVNFAGSVNILEKNSGGSNCFPAQASSSIASAVGALADNSEDQSSKSSTAASAPRHGFDMLSVSPFSWDKNVPKNLSGKGLTAQRGQMGSVLADPSKKFRGRERVKYEKENSHSSMESDSRSSNFVFMQAGNGRLSEASIHYNGESDEDILGERQLSDDQAASNEANVRGAADILSHNLGAGLSREVHEENGGNCQQPARRDPLVDSVLTLNSVQEALEKELLKFREMGRGSYFTSADTASCVNSSDCVNHEESAQNASGSLDIEEKKSQMEQARDALRVKISQVSKLEATLNSKNLHKSKAHEHGETERLEAELEVLYEQYIEADIMDLATFSAFQDAKHAAVNPRILLAEQKAVVDEQSQLRPRLKQTESKQTECEAVKMKRQAKTYSEEIVETQEAFSLKKSIKKLSWYSLFQMLMLFWLGYSQLIADSGAVVPT